MPPALPQGRAARAYARLETFRNPYLRRARACTSLTIPSLLPPEGADGSTDLPTPYQDIGARGLNNLAAKLLQILFPPNEPFQRHTMDDFLIQKVTGREGMRASVEEALDRYDRTLMSIIEATGYRPAAFEALKLLISTGNVLEYETPDNGPKLFRLDNYVVKRDPVGNVLRIVAREKVSGLELPENVLDELQESGKSNKAANEDEDTYDLYTMVERTRSGWTVFQEVGEIELPGSRGTYPKDKCPWNALRLIVVHGEDYGRSYVEEYLGALLTLEGLTKAIVQAAAASSKVIFLVKPNSSTKPEALTKSESGDVRTGNPDDVGTVQAEKYADLRVPLEVANRLVESLSAVFLMTSSIQRNGDRVTATEWRYMVAELEVVLGGIYATLGKEWQLSKVRVIAHRMQRSGRLPRLPEGVQPAIVTGVDALGRGNDLTKLTQFLDLLQRLGPDVAQGELVLSDFVKRAGAAVGIDMKGLVPTEEQRAEQQQQSQLQQLTAQLGPNAVTQLGGIARNQLSNQGE
jgi:hypothetical protein